MTDLRSLGGAVVLAALFHEYFISALMYATGLKHSAALGLVDEGLIVILAGLLFLQTERGLRIFRHFGLWIPYLLLFTISWAANRSSPVLGGNLLFAYLKPFILALGAVNFLDLKALPRIFRWYLGLVLLQLPFLAYQVATLGYLTGIEADNYVGALGDAHLVAAVSIVPCLWLLGKIYWSARMGSGVSFRDLALAVLLFGLPVLCEGKFIYLGAIIGIAGFLVLSERLTLVRMAPRLVLLIGPLVLMVFYFGFQYFQDMEYRRMFEFFQKLEAYYITFFELPKAIPFPFLGAGPGTYGSAIALKSMPPLADHYFGEAMRGLEAGGTFMTPFSEINGAFGELGYMGPFLLLLPYVAHLFLCVRAAGRITDPFIGGALVCAGSLLVLLLFGTLFLPSLVQSQLTFPCFFLSSMVLMAARPIGSSEEGEGNAI